ncbi:MAG: hypothetical protein J0L92_20420 [Deltaproteobacteria bacterium]|nr:hypothetical protein [Deltaproteobacteria bacterium]
MASKKSPAVKSTTTKSPTAERATRKIPTRAAPRARVAAAGPAPSASSATRAHEPDDTQFRARFEAMDRALRANPDVRVLAPSRLVTSPVNARMVRMALEQLEQSSGISSAELAPYAPHLFGTVLHWLGPTDATGLHRLGGEVRLQSVGALTRAFDPAPSWRLFDDHPGSGDGVLTLLRPHEGRWQLGVYEDGVVHPMDIDVREYLDALVDLRAVFGLQWLFVRESRHRAGLAAKLDALAALLDLDVSKYRARLR